MPGQATDARPGTDDGSYMRAKASELSQCVPAELTADDVHMARFLYGELRSLPPAQVPPVAQQLLRVFMSYRAWMLPTAWRTREGGPERWCVAVPAPGAKEGGAQLLPLASDHEAFMSLCDRSVAKTDGNVGGSETLQPVTSSGADAVMQYLPLSQPTGRLEGLVLEFGTKEQLVFDKELVPLLRIWARTLHLEALFAEELVEDATDHPVPSQALADILSTDAELHFVRTPNNDDLARDKTGGNIMLLTSPDAAALATAAYGSQQLRKVKPNELYNMAEQARDLGYALTLGPDRVRRSVEDGSAHVPFWHTRTVSAEWLASALRRGGASTVL